MYLKIPVMMTIMTLPTIIPILPLAIKKLMNILKCYLGDLILPKVAYMCETRLYLELKRCTT